MPNIRPPGRRFGPVAPGGGAVIGAGLVSAAQALSSFADVQTEIDRLDQVQFEKVERSEAIAQFTAKQIQRNNTASQILASAKENRNFEGVQQDMNEWEEGFNQELFQGRSQEFRDVFETIDRPARGGSINKMGTAVEAGRLGIVRDNYQIAADNFVESVDALTTPEEINEFFDTYDETGVGLGFGQAAINAASGENRRAAMERHIRSLPLFAGLGALSDEDVAKALGEEGRERMRRDLNETINTLSTAQEITSAAHAGVVGLDVLRALSGGEPATALISRIRGDDGISPTRQDDMVDLVAIIEKDRAKGPKPIRPDKLRANHTFSERAMKVVVGAHDEIANKDGTQDQDRIEERAKLFSEGMAILAEATRLSVRGQFNRDKLTGLGFQLLPVSEGLMIIDQDKESFLERAARGAISRVGVFGEIASDLLAKKVPNSIVQKARSDMFLGKGRYGGLSPAQRSVMANILISTASITEGADQTMSAVEAFLKSGEVFSEAEKRFNSEEFGLIGEDAEQVGGLIFNSGEPAIEARQQPRQSLLADTIRSGLNQGMTVERIRAQAADMPLFSDEAFNRALSTMPGIAQEPTLEQLGVGRLSDPGIEFIKQQEGFAGTAKTVLNESQPTGGFGHFGDFEEGEEVTPERAEELLREDVAEAEEGVKRTVPQFAKLSESEFNALVSLVFNVGETAFNGSVAVEALNEALSGRVRDEDAIQRFLIEAFDKDKGFVFAKGKKIRGLVNRRAAERRLFLGTT